MKSFDAAKILSNAVDDVSGEFDIYMSLLMSAIYKGDMDNRKSHAVRLISLTNTLHTILQDNTPEWITPLYEAFKKIAAQRQDDDREKADKIIYDLCEGYVTSKAFDWGFEDLRETPLPADFEATFSKYFNQSEAPALFEALIAKLKEVIESGLVDSVRTLNALEKLMETLKANTGKSSFSVMTSQSYASHVLKLAAVKSLEKIQFIGPLIQSIRETNEKLGISVNEVLEQTRKEIADEIDDIVKPLQIEGAGQLSLPAPVVVIESESAALPAKPPKPKRK